MWIEWLSCYLWLRDIQCRTSYRITDKGLEASCFNKVLRKLTDFESLMNDTEQRGGRGFELFVTQLHNIGT